MSAPHYPHCQHCAWSNQHHVPEHATPCGNHGCVGNEPVVQEGLFEVGT